jgi:hypothetical protein
LKALEISAFRFDKLLSAIALAKIEKRDLLIAANITAKGSDSIQLPPWESAGHE